MSENTAYTVHTVPWYIRPFYLLISWSLGAAMYGLFAINRLTCRVEYVRNTCIQHDQNYIYALWHQSLIPYFMTHLRYRQPYVWMNHPLWFMKPVHVILTLIGTRKIALGSSGYGGKEALHQIVADLKKGYNTVLNPDGPAGPPCQLKPGVLKMSQQSGVPIVPVRIVCTSFYRLHTWDQKRVPKPFSKITVIYGEPVQVGKENSEEAGVFIQQNL